MRRLSRRLVWSGALDVVATAVPGMPDMLVLGKVKQMERAAAAGQPERPDFIVLDAPAAGHAVRFLQSPQGVLDATGGGPVRAAGRRGRGDAVRPVTLPGPAGDYPRGDAGQRDGRDGQLLEEKRRHHAVRCRGERAAPGPVPAGV